jgi:hypothetical protein
MSSVTRTLTSRRRLYEAALVTVAGYAILGPAIHPAVALGSPVRVDLLGLAAMGLLSPRPGPARDVSKFSRYRPWVFPAVLGALAGVAVVAPLVAIPWLLLPGLAMTWAGTRPTGRWEFGWRGIFVVVLMASLNGTAVAAATAHGLRGSPQEFARQDFRVNQLLPDVPLHDAWAVDLKGSASPTMENLTRAFRHRAALGVTPAIVGLGVIRGAAGKLLGWDEPRWASPEGSFISRLTPLDRRCSSTKPGTTLGIWRVLYALPREGLVETQNATVHVAVAGAIGERAEGARLFLAFRVREVNWTTRLYMRLIDPARRFFIYPFLLRQFAHTWEREAWGHPNPSASGERP